jgi:hypothetical protein
MSQYLVAVRHPDDFDSSVVTEAAVRDINVLNEEMDAAGVRIFAGGLSAASDARSLGAQGCRRLSDAGRGARVCPHSAGWRGPLILRASRTPGVPRAGSTSLLPSGTTWLIENREHLELNKIR